MVASEVRGLASRSAAAAKEIKELIQDTVRKVDDGSHLVSESGQTLEQIVLSVKKVCDIVAEIAAASREQATGIDQVNKAVSQMDSMTQQNAALVEQAAGASQSVARRANELSTLMAHYRVSDEPAAAIAPPAAVPAKSVVTKFERRTPSPLRGDQHKDSSPSQPIGPKAAVAGHSKPTANDADWQEF